MTVTVDAVIYYRVSNPTMVCQCDWSYMSYVICVNMTSLTITITDKNSNKATNNVEDFSHSTRLLGATTLR